MHRTHATVCPLDCPDTCSLSVTVRDQKIISLRGSRANPYTDNAICSKVARFYPEFVHGEQRLCYPLKRTGARGSGQYQRISWEEAIELIYQGFQQAISRYGAESVLGFNYAGPSGELASNSLDRQFFHHLGATRLHRGPLCGGVRSGAYSSLFGNTAGMSPEQALHADLIIVWGGNTTVSNLHLARVIQQAQKKGTQLIVIDAKRTRIADRANLFLQVKPGTDIVLAMALAAELERRDGLDKAFIAKWVMGSDTYLQQARQYGREQLEAICGITLQQFDAFADYYLQAKCVALSIGNGMERGYNGGSSLRAVMALQALTGHFGRLGAGVLAKQGFAFPRASTILTCPDLNQSAARTLNIVDVSKALLDEQLDPPLRALMIYNHNPLAVHPEQNRMRRALNQESLFIVGCDVVMTDSMQYADVILPAASVFETDDIYASYGHSYLQRSKAIIPPVGESLSNTEIFRRLAARFGMDDTLFQLDDAALMDQVFDLSDPRFDGKKVSELPLGQALEMGTQQQKTMIMCDNVFPNTASGKIELFSEMLEQQYGYGVPRYTALPIPENYPLMIISPASDARINATFGGCKASLCMQTVEIHPQDAEKFSISNGDKVKIWNQNGAVVMQAEISDRVQVGVLFTPKGAWLSTSETGQTVNALMSADLRTDIFDGACYNDTFVTLARI